MKKLIINKENPNGKLIDLTAEEISQNEKDEENFLIRKQQEKDVITKLKIDQKNGNTKFLELGLSQDEATALTGYKPPIEETE
jgi:hypothetical protein